MKKYGFIIGVTLSILSAIWLVSLVQLPIGGKIGERTRSTARGEVSMAAILFCVGIILILLEAHWNNPRRKKEEKDLDESKTEILAMLPESGQTRLELDEYISESLGRVGLYGLRKSELERVKNHLQRLIAEKSKAQVEKED